MSIEYIQDHLPQFGSEDNSQLIEHLLVLGLSSFKSITEGKIDPKKSQKLLKKATSKYSNLSRYLLHVL